MSGRFEPAVDFDKVVDKQIGAELLEIAKQGAFIAEQEVNRDTGAYEDWSVLGKKMSDGTVVFSTNDYAGHIIEYGSSKQAPQAPLRKAAARLGRFTSSPKPR